MFKKFDSIEEISGSEKPVEKEGLIGKYKVGDQEIPEFVQREVRYVVRACTKTALLIITYCFVADKTNVLMDFVGFIFKLIKH